MNQSPILIQMNSRQLVNVFKMESKMTKNASKIYITQIGILFKLRGLPDNKGFQRWPTGLKTEKYSAEMLFYFVSYPKAVSNEKKSKRNRPLHIGK